jgi:hypothetical protein
MTHGIDAFLRKFKLARDYNSKELKMTIAEAEQLSIGISLLLSRELVLSNRVIELQDMMISGGAVSGSGADGGGFRDAG